MLNPIQFSNILTAIELADNGADGIHCPVVHLYVIEIDGGLFTLNEGRLYYLDGWLPELDDYNPYFLSELAGVWYSKKMMENCVEREIV